MEGIIRRIKGEHNPSYTVYMLVIEDKNGDEFRIPIETRYLSEIIENKGNIIGEKVHYEDDGTQMLYFID